MKSICSVLKNTLGNVAIEFAILIPVMFLLFSGVVNFGLILSNQNELNGVASVGILYAFGNSPVTTAVKAVMDNSTTNSGNAFSPLTTSVTQFCQCLTTANVSCASLCPDGSSPGLYDTVTAQSGVTPIALDFVLPLTGGQFITNVTATVRTQ